MDSLESTEELQPWSTGDRTSEAARGRGAAKAEKSDEPMEDIYEFKVCPEEASYLKRLASRDSSLVGLLDFQESSPSTNLIIQLSRAQANQLRERLMTRMNLVGLDENYEPTKEGQVLEDLIERFFIR
jgi:hypothetical protein